MSSGIDLCAVPVGTTSSGTWDFVHFESLAALSVALCTVLTFLSLFVAVARIHVNRQCLSITDYFTVLAVVFSIAYLVLISLVARYYRHDWNLPACWFDAHFAKIQFCLVLFSGFVQFFPRAAIFLLYRQLFQVHNRTVQIAIWVGLIATFVINFPNIPIALAIEIPRAGEGWTDVLTRLNKPSNDHGFSSARLWGPIQGSASVALDIFAFVLPLPIIARLNLAAKKRTQLILLFSTALLGVAASIIALVYKFQLLIRENQHQGNQMWLLGPVNICIDVEANIAIIIGCMPAFSKFMRLQIIGSRSFQSLRSRFGGSNPTGPKSSTSGPQRPLQGTIGSPFPRNKANPAYYELTDTNILNSKYTVEGGKSSTATTIESNPSGIVKTVDVTQESRHQTDSTDKLV